MCQVFFPIIQIQIFRSCTFVNLNKEVGAIVVIAVVVVVCDDVHVKVDGDVVHDCNMYNDIANADDDYVDNDGDDG